MLHYSFAEVHFKHKIIRYLKAGKGTTYYQLLDLKSMLQRLNPTLITVAVHGPHHVSGGNTQEDEELLLEYFQSDEFVAERLIWTKEAYSLSV